MSNLRGYSNAEIALEKIIGKCYSNNYGKIKALNAISLVKETIKSPGERFSFLLETKAVSAVEGEYLSRFKGLVHIIRQLRNTEGVPYRLENLIRSYDERTDFSNEDRDLYLPLVRFFKAHYHALDLFLANSSVSSDFLIEGKVTKKQVQEFKQRSDETFFQLAEGFLDSLYDFFGKIVGRHSLFEPFGYVPREVLDRPKFFKNSGSSQDDDEQAEEFKTHSDRNFFQLAEGFLDSIYGFFGKIVGLFSPIRYDPKEGLDTSSTLRDLSSSEDDLLEARYLDNALNATLDKILRDRKSADSNDLLLVRQAVQVLLNRLQETSFYTPSNRYLIQTYHLNNLGERLHKDMDFTAAQANKVSKGMLSTQGSLTKTLDVVLNPCGLELLINNVDCCIVGPFGKSKEASILYLLDPDVHMIRFTPGEYAVGLAIFAKVEGYHASSPDESTTYLLLEGCPINQNYYSCVDKVNLKNPESGKGTSPLNIRNGLSMPQLVYVLGLKTAKDLKIPKLFINAEHTGRQKSVEDVVLEAARANVKEAGRWSLKDGKFILRKDPLTGGNFAHIVAGNRCFEYTHFLQKKPLSPALVSELQNDPSWNGEGYFDTWYGWNKFIGKTYADWSPELKQAHPYAGSVWERAKSRLDQGLHPESYWNLGIGYCKGFEVDVEKECERLGIS